MEHLTPNQRAWRRFWSHRPALISTVFLAILFLLVLIWPWIQPYAFESTSDAQFQPPSTQHWFGTDVHGRDVFTRAFHGARVSLLVGLVGALVAVTIGVTWGSIAGFKGGWIDSLLMRIVDVLYSLPSIIFVIVLMTTMETLVKGSISKWLGAEYTSKVRMIFLFAGLGAVSWLNMARIVRGQVLSLRHRAFIDASRTLGASQVRILWYHILPNVYGVVITYATLTIPAIILYESFLSYLGLGIQPPSASWGSLIADGAGQLNAIRTYWWLIVCPAGMLVTTLLALNFVGDGLRDAWDPRQSSR